MEKSGLSFSAFFKSSLPYVVLISVVSLVYIPVAGHDFLYQWDDQWVVMNHYTSGGFNWDNISRIFTDFYHGQYAPLNELNYLFIYAVSGYSPLPFHLVSLCWHLANVCLVYLFIKKLLSLKYGTGFEGSGLVSFFTALLWGIHPVNVESVAWLSASKILIYSFFYLLALISYLEYLSSKRNLFFILTLFFFVCSFGGKEQAVTMPVCLLLIDYFLGRDFRDKDLWIEKISFFSLSLLGGFLTILSQGNGGGEDLVYSYGYRILFACYALFEYFVKAILPVNLSYLYPFPVLPGEALPIRFWFYPFIIIFGLAIVFLYRRNRVLVFSVFFLIIHVAVALHIISLSRFTIVADRYIYIGCVGVSFFTIWLVYKAKSYLKPKSFRFIIIFSVSYMLYFGIYSYLYSQVWKDTDILKSHIRELLKNREDESLINVYKGLYDY